MRVSFINDVLYENIQRNVASEPTVIQISWRSDDELNLWKSKFTTVTLETESGMSHAWHGNWLVI